MTKIRKKLTKNETLRKTTTNLDVTSSAVDSLFVLDGELNHNRFSLVGERFRELGSTGVETSILAGLDTLISLLVSVVFASRELELSIIVLVLGLNPTLLPCSI